MERLWAPAMTARGEVGFGERRRALGELGVGHDVLRVAVVPRGP